MVVVVAAVISLREAYTYVHRGAATTAGAPEWMDGWMMMDGWMDGWMDERTNEWTSGRIDEWANARMDEWISG